MTTTTTSLKQDLSENMQRLTAGDKTLNKTLRLPKRHKVIPVSELTLRLIFMMKTFKEDYRTLRKDFNGLRDGIEDAKTVFYRILPHTQTQMSMSRSITHEDKKECKFEPNQQEVTKVITNTDRAISCEITYPSTENFSDKTSRTYKVERNLTSKPQETNSQDLQSRTSYRGNSRRLCKFLRKHK
jgi:hypothetical protein